MSWPLSQDFNEAVQNPATAFGDPELKGGTVTTNPMGMPLPRSGNYADVYQITAATGQKWAVKCFTRPTSAGLDARYAAVSDHLNTASLPFTVGFKFLPQGIRVRGQWFPIVKMQWVDGFPINAFVRDNLNRSTILENMLSLWVRLCRRLRETGMAHGDIQHGNVLLVPAGGHSLGLKLVDYDGMFVPALANQPSGEAGHASYQHPDRVAHGVYSADLDRFPHLVVATALRGLLIGGKALWDKYDNGDNLLFTEKDFKAPGQSKLMRELWETGDPFTVGLVGHLALSCTKPMHQTPWLDQLMPGGQPPILTPSQERQAAVVLGFAPPPEAGPPAAMPVILPPQPVPPPPAYPPAGYAMPPQLPVPPPDRPTKGVDLEDDDEEEEADFDDLPRRRAAKKGANVMPLAIGGAVALVAVVAVVALSMFGGKKPDVAVKPDENTPVEPAPKPVEPGPKTPDPVRTPGDPPDKVARPNPAEPGVPKGGLVWSQPTGDSPQQPGRMGRFSLDGGRILSACQQSGVVDVLDAKDGRKVATFREHEPPANVFAFPLPNGTAMSVAREPVMMLWEQDTGRAKARAPLAHPEAGLTAVRADRVGKYVALVRDEKVSVIDIEKGSEVVGFTTPKAPFSHAACGVRPDGSAVLSITPDHKLRVQSLPGGQVQSEVAVKADKAGIVSAWSDDGKLAAVREFDGRAVTSKVYVVNVATGETVSTIGGEPQVPAAFTRDGRRLAIAQRGAVELYDPTTGQKTAEAKYSPTATDNVTDLDLSPDGTQAVVTTLQRTHYLASFVGGTPPVAAPPFTVTPNPPNPPGTTPPATAAGGGRVVWSVPAGDGPTDRVMSAAFTLDGTKVFAGPVGRGTVHVWDARTGQRLTSYRDAVPQSNVSSFALPGGRVGSLTPADTVVTIWDAATGKTNSRTPAIDVRLSSVTTADRKGQYVVLGGPMMNGSHPESVVNLETGRVVATITTEAPAVGHGGAVLAADGSAVLSIASGSLRITAIPTGRIISQNPLKVDNPVLIADWSPARKLAGVTHRPAGGGLPAGLHVVNTDTGEVVKVLPDVGDRSARFSADGSLLAAATRNTVTLWRTADWTPVAAVPLPPGVGAATTVNVTADGRRAVCAHNTVIHLVAFDAGGATEAADQLTELAALASTDAGVDASRRRAVDRTGKLVFFATDAAVYPVDVATKKMTARYAPDGTVGRLWPTTGGDVVVEVRQDKRVELHVVDPQTGKLTGAGVVVVSPAADDPPKHVNVSAGGTLATVVKANGHLALFDLKAGKFFFAYHPDPPAVAAFPSADGERIVANCGKRIHTMVVANRPAFNWLRPPGFDEDLVVEDASPDAKAVAVRTRGADNTGTKFTIITFADWKNPAVVTTAATGNDAHLRFVGDGRRVVVSGEGRLALHDAATGKLLAAAVPKLPGANMTPVSGPGGETIVFGFGTGATLYRTGIGGASAPDAVATAGPKRLPVPDGSALAAAEKAVKDTYAADYAKKPPADRKKLAERLYADARETAKDASAQFVMLKEATALAVEVSDAPLAVKAADAANDVFEVDGFALKLAALEKIAAGTTNTQTLRAAADAVQELVEELAEKDEYEKAVKLAAVAVSCLSRGGSAVAQKEFDQRLTQLRKLKDAFEAVKAASDKLKARPEDKDASTQVGRFRAFAQGKWDDAFKLLAAGSDADLKKLADMELSAATDDLTDLKRGDAWRDYAAKLPEADRPAATARAKLWYAKALVSGKGGPERAAAEKALRFTSGGGDYWPGLIAEQFVPRVGKKVRGFLDYGIEFSADAPDVAALNLSNIEVKWTGVIVPPAAGRYKLVADTRDTVRVTLGTKPDQKKVIEALDKGIATKEAYYLFGDRPVAIVVEYGGPVRRGDHGLKLKWLRPGGKSEEPIPASAFFHNKADEKLVTDK